MRGFYLFLALGVNLIPLKILIGKNSIPRSMSALGDSTSTATLAQYHRSRIWNPLTHAQPLLEFLRFGIRRGDKFSLSDWNLSWTTGIGSSKVNSHAARLKKLNAQLHISNFSEPGATLEDIYKKQLPQLKLWSQKSLRQAYPDYITLLTGANDICAEHTQDTAGIKKFLKLYNRIAHEILEESPQSKVLIVALPPYQDIYDSRKAHLLAFPMLHNCQALWKLAPLCPPLTHKGQEGQALVKKQVNLINAGLSQMISKLRKDYGDRIRFAEKTAQRHIHPQDLSIDCFHPNDKGQSDLAEITWNSSWWKVP